MGRAYNPVRVRGSEAGNQQLQVLWLPERQSCKVMSQNEPGQQRLAVVTCG